MRKDSMKMFGVVAITLVVVVLFLTLPVFYYFAEVPLWCVGIAAVVYVALAAAMLYYAYERYKEIKEGLDDAVDNY